MLHCIKGARSCITTIDFMDIDSTIKVKFRKAYKITLSVIMLSLKFLALCGGNTLSLVNLHLGIISDQQLTELGVGIV